VERLKILAVDDELGMRAGIQRALRDFSVSLHDLNEEVTFSVEVAETGEQALQAINENPPAILLLDHKLPGISGLDVLDQVAGRFDGMLTVMVTAYASLETAVTAIKRGAYDFLAKPFTPSELKNVVRKAAESIILARQARKLAAEKRQVRFQFISVLAHELKAPLAAIEGYLRIMRDRQVGNELASYDHMMERSLIRLEGMRKLIIDLLDLTRIESGRKRRDLQEVDVVDVARAAMETAQPQATPRGISVNLSASAPERMTADRGEIEIILNNLITNSIKYNRDGGRVDVTVGAEGEDVVIAVSDTGIGLTPEEAAKLFNDFVRIKNARTSNILGSGLGLSIVKKLALLYGGDAAVVSQSEAGSTFTVRLKRTLERQSGANDAAGNNPVAAGG
jgi:signal transduction histidine kinase